MCCLCKEEEGPDGAGMRILTFCIFSMSMPKWDRCSARLGSRTMSSSSYEYTSRAEAGVVLEGVAQDWPDHQSNPLPWGSLVG